jgi:peptidoglycan-associated lipoprotein
MAPVIGRVHRAFIAKECRMTGRAWQTALAVSILLVAAVTLTGCPKKPAGAGAAAAGSAGGGAGGAAGGAAGAGGGAGGGAAAGGAAGQPGGVSSGGTTLPPGPVPSEFSETTALKDIHFEFDRAEIRGAEAEILNANATWLKSNARVLVLIEGHCDERGTNEYNLALGQRRANATRDYLVARGIDTRRISLISYGKERPVCTEHSEACWARNRRAHFLVKP